MKIRSYLSPLLDYPQLWRAGRLPSAERTESTCAVAVDKQVRREPPLPDFSGHRAHSRRSVMSERHLPVRPSLTQLKHQAKDLLREMKRARPDAKLAEAQFALARSYGVASWPRLALACRIVDAIWRDDVRAVRTLVTKHPNLLHEMARGTASCNWGPPMSYAANLGRDEIIKMLHGLGAKDLKHALARALLQGQIETAQLLQQF